MDVGFTWALLVVGACSLGQTPCNLGESFSQGGVAFSLFSETPESCRRTCQLHKLPAFPRTPLGLAGNPTPHRVIAFPQSSPMFSLSSASPRPLMAEEIVLRTCWAIRCSGPSTRWSVLQLLRRVRPWVAVSLKQVFRDKKSPGLPGDNAQVRNGFD